MSERTYPLFEPPDNVVPLVKPTVSVVYVTPEMAGRWLEKNLNNRAIRMADVRRWSRDMADGKWQLTGEAVKFGPDGRLLDGQNRLHAIVKSGATIPLFVARGIPDEAQAVMDTGRKRTAADALAMRGEKNTALVAAAVRIALMVEDGVPELSGHEVSHPRVISFIDEHPDIRSSAETIKPYSRRSDCTPAMVVYTHWRLTQIAPDEATQFWIDVAEKVGLPAGDGALVLGQRLAEARRNRENLSRPVLLSLIYRSWNARRMGTLIKLLRVMASTKDQQTGVWVTAPVAIPTPQ